MAIGNGRVGFGVEHNAYFNGGVGGGVDLRGFVQTDAHAMPDVGHAEGQAIGGKAVSTVAVEVGDGTAWLDGCNDIALDGQQLVVDVSLFRGRSTDNGNWSISDK